MDTFFDFIRSLDAFKEVQKDFATKKFSHAYLFWDADRMFLPQFLQAAALIAVCANGGCGSCLVCRKTKNGNHADVLVFPREKEYLTADEARQIASDCYVLPIESNIKVYVVNNFDKADAATQNKLLKTLEEPPADTVFFLGASNESAVLNTIKSRCRCIAASQSTFEGVVKLLKANGIDEKKAAIAAAVNNCNPQKSYSCAVSPSFFAMYDDVVNVLQTLDSSKNALTAVARLQNYSNLTEVLGVIHVLFYQSLVQQTQTDLLLLTPSNNDIIKISEKFSSEALLQILPMIDAAVTKLAGHCNANSVLDSLILSILEVKHKCPKL